MLMWEHLDPLALSVHDNSPTAHSQVCVCVNVISSVCVLRLFVLEHGQGVVVEALQRQKGRGGVIRLTKTALCLGRTLRSQAV